MRVINLTDIKFENKPPRYECDISDKKYAIRLVGGRYDGSICKITSITKAISYSRYIKRTIENIKFEWEDNKKAYAYTNNFDRLTKFKGSNIEILADYIGDSTIVTTDLELRDCFGTLFEIGKIVSYKRDSKQIFAVVEEINDIGRIKMRRIYNQSNKGYDYINFGTQQEYLILDKYLIENLMLLRLKNND